jgi:uncharacterized membrane protein YidH (DUF202 family)
MFKKIKEKGVETIRKCRTKAMILGNAVAITYLTFPIQAFAEDSYIAPINKLKTVALSLVGSAGAIVLIYGIVKFAESFQKKDQGGEYNAIYTIMAGAIMAGASALLSALT